MKVRTRYAPSPTGNMHIGNLRTALYGYLFAKKNNGEFVVRIEDTDQNRYQESATDIIFRTLEQTGLVYDEGPGKEKGRGPYFQSQRREIYKKYAQMLVEKGAAYYCFCTDEILEKERKAAEEKGQTYKYPKTCLSLKKEEIQKRIEAGEPYVIRQNMPETGSVSFEDVIFGTITVDCADLDDMVLLKSDGLPTYNFANVVDDHLMEITHVMRGTEYLSSAPKYNLLYEAFGWTPPTYIHLPVVMRDATRKLSKRYGDPSFEDLLDMGYLRDAIINFIALLGWSPRSEREFFTLKELEECFDVEGLNKSPSIFDMDKLTWFNAEYMRKLSFEEFYELAKPWMAKVLDPARFDLRRLAELLQARTEVLNRIPGMIGFLAEMPEFDNDLYTHKKMKTTPEIAKQALTAVRPVLEGVKDWTEQGLHDAVMAFIPETGLKNGQVLWPLRIAISGLASTPGGAFEIAYLLGREETLRRLDSSLEKL